MMCSLQAKKVSARGVGSSVELEPSRCRGIPGPEAQEPTAWAPALSALPALHPPVPLPRLRPSPSSLSLFARARDSQPLVDAGSLGFVI